MRDQAAAQRGGAEIEAGEVGAQVDVELLQRAVRLLEQEADGVVDHVAAAGLWLALVTARLLHEPADAVLLVGGEPAMQRAAGDAAMLAIGQVDGSAAPHQVPSFAGIDGGIEEG